MGIGLITSAAPPRSQQRTDIFEIGGSGSLRRRNYTRGATPWAAPVSELQRRARRFRTTLPASVAAMSVEPATGPADHDARFAEYVEPELDVLYRVAMSITRRRVDAEDLVQDTLLRAYRAIDRFDGRYPRAWLLTIMRNAQVNRVRRKRPELMRDPDETMERVADESDTGAPADAPLVDAELSAPLEAALNALPQKFYDVVRLVDIDDLSYREAADVMGIPVGTVMSRLHRARRNIRAHLEASQQQED